jgi:predicted dithiol-disulfide oxidoreductase (DUF899 family)
MITTTPQPEVSTNRSPLDAELDALEAEIGGLQARRAALRNRRPREKVRDYRLTASSGEDVRLSQLFGGTSDMFLIHNMGSRCRYCTLWADGFVGLLPYLERRAAFVLVSPDPPERQRAFAAERNWPFRMVSAAATTLFEDFGFVDGEGAPMPGVSTLHRSADGGIERVQRAEFGPGDQFCAAWHLLDLLDGGRGDWEPGGCA